MMEAFKLRTQGWTYQAIADKLGISSAQVYQWVRKEVARRAEETREVVDEITAIELERLDKIVEGIWAKVEAGSLEHIDVFLRVSARRSKLLGLDAATTHKVEVTDNRRQLTDEEMYDRYRALQERLAKAGFKPNPVLFERNPFQALKEAQVIEGTATPVKVSEPNDDEPETDAGDPGEDEEPED